MSDKFRRGAKAMEQAQKESAAKSKGGFTSFAPYTSLKDGEEKYYLFLNPLEDLPVIDLINFIPAGKRKRADGSEYTVQEMVIAKTDASIGEDEDPMVENWDGRAADSSIAVVVELEPTFEEINGRQKPVGFEVKTREFERAVRDAKGDIVEGDFEDVVAPEVAFLTGSNNTVFPPIRDSDNNYPIEAFPIRVKRLGADASTTYTATPFPDSYVDLEALLEIDGISYLDEKERDKVYKSAPEEDLSDEDYEDALKAYALELGKAMLDKRLDELIDPERYDRIYSGIKSSLDIFGNKKKASKGAKGKAAPKKERAARRPAASRRPAKVADPEPEEAEDETPDEPVEEKPKRAPRSRKPAPKKEEPVAEEPDEPADEPEDEPTEAPKKPAPKPAAGRAQNERLAALKARRAAKA